MRDFKKYSVWELGHEITLDIYNTTAKFPKEELYGITNQMRRAAYSIPANIVEGCGRESDAEFKRFLTISQGSASELEYFIILSKDLGYLTADSFEIIIDKVNKVRRSVFNLISKL
jgi:four helix bundle protein